MRRVKPMLVSGLLALTLSVGSLGISPMAHADEALQVEPSELAIFGDILIARPFSIAATAAGLGVFFVTMPFTVLGGNGEATAKTLVGAPFKSAFMRCLGCTPKQAESVRTLR